MDQQPQYITPDPSAGPNLNQQMPPPSIPPQQPSPGGGGVNKIAVVILVLVLLGAGGYVAYRYLYKSGGSVKGSEAQVVWDKFLQAPQPQTYTAEYSLDMKERATDGMGGNTTFFDVQMQTQGQIYNNLDKTSTTTEAQISGTWQRQPQSSWEPDFSATTSYASVNGNSFFKDDNDLQTNLSFSPKNQWVKYDGKYGSAGSVFFSIYANPLTEITETNLSAFPQVLRQVWTDPKFIKMQSFVGQEDLNGHKVYHYKMALDKEALKKEEVDQYTKDREGVHYADWEKVINQHDAELAGTRIDNISLKIYEIWINPQNSQLEKLQLEGSIPNFKLLIFEDEAKVKNSGDSRRMSDISSIGRALSMFKDQYSGYPDGAGGIPTDLIINGFKDYFPKAPPTAGACTDYYNSYWYNPVGKSRVANGKKVFDSFELTFCLAEGLKNVQWDFMRNVTAPATNYEAGVSRLTPGGLQTGIPCPGKPEQCVGPQYPKLSLNDIAKEPEVQTSYKLDLEFSNIGQAKTVTVPSDYIDLSTSEKQNEYLKQNLKMPTKESTTKKPESTPVSERDKQRMADINALATALEYSFGGKDSYPNSLNELVPTYIAVVPAAPIPADGTCTTQQNIYKYKKITSDKYQLTFCLGSGVGSYVAGMHTLTQGGIQ